MLKKVLYFFPIFLLFLSTLSCSKETVITDSEREWLSENDSITVAIYPYYPPYQFVNEQNEIDGIFIDYLKLIEQKIGYKFKKKRYNHWPQLIQDVKNNDVQCILEIQETKERKSYLNFYTPLFKSPHVIVTRSNANFGINFNSLTNKTIVLPEDYAITEILKRTYPNFNIVTEKDEQTCLIKLNSGEYDAYIGPKALVNYYIRIKKLNDIKITSDTTLEYEPGVAVNNSNTILHNIFSKVLSNITKEEKESILNNWYYSNVTPFYQTPNFWIMVFLTTLLLFILGASFNTYLKYKIKQKTEELIIARDIAEESNRLKTNFIYNIPQEIRTPMNGIIGLSEFLTDEDLSSKERQKYTQMIIGNSKELLSIIDNILEISQLQTKRFTLRLIEINLRDVFKALISQHQVKAEEKNIKISIKNKLTNSENLVLMDRPKLNKILNVFMDNAIKHTNNGTIAILCSAINGELSISIKDTGIGIGDTKKSKIITNLNITNNTTNTIEKYDGIGLGLTIAKKNADFIGGQITLISQKDEGSTFTLKIPHNQVQNNNSHTKGNTEKSSLKTEKNIILIAEDGETNFLFLKTILTKMNDYDFTIYRAKNGQEAVTICEENKSIDLVLMDIKMPIMNGYDATAYIKKMRPNLPIIAQTAYSIEEDVQKALDAGCDDFVSKPVDKKILKPMLSKYFPVFKNRNKTS
ncbi:His Kinase A (phospho-acceptor) domain-containing protein [Aquimarina amphilecti]|uniref:histidine kinase n=1 Tax=Aquimarina amphilecti TaxID=1038014 RepID=A0A1H7Q5S5_AQUAM|nr:transporter substrate-binding domain-containing protein [Aquimarina amphilecti]SEL42647.1 His Kinase A (phospho-acceptor) domain-containing protein [Aquimarina amphilecti]